MIDPENLMNLMNLIWRVFPSKHKWLTESYQWETTTTIARMLQSNVAIFCTNVGLPDERPALANLFKDMQRTELFKD